MLVLRLRAPIHPSRFAVVCKVRRVNSTRNTPKVKYEVLRPRSLGMTYRNRRHIARFGALSFSNTFLMHSLLASTLGKLHPPEYGQAPKFARHLRETTGPKETQEPRQGLDAERGESRRAIPQFHVVREPPGELHRGTIRIASPRTRGWRNSD